MFIYRRTIYLRETDATGVFYFSQQFNLALETLEAYFLTKKFTLRELIEKSDFLMPIVHAEADFFAPLYVGDQIEIELSVGAINTSSFSLQTRWVALEGRKLLGTTKIIHATVLKETGKAFPIPELILQHLR